MNISAQDMKVLPLFAWLDATLSSSMSVLLILKSLKKMLTNLPVSHSDYGRNESLKLPIDERAAVYLYTMECPKLPDKNTNSSIYFLMKMYLSSERTSVEE
jgi:hypothetical protein